MGFSLPRDAMLGEVIPDSHDFGHPTDGRRYVRYFRPRARASKPMIEVGGRPVIWHIIKMYSARGVNDFEICCGFRGYIIKEYFASCSAASSE
jgi:hypothetical protein